MIENFVRDSVGFSSDSRLCVDTKTGKRPNSGCFNSHDDQYNLCLDIISHYKTIHSFDYEEFYDYL